MQVEAWGVVRNETEKRNRRHILKNKELGLYPKDTPKTTDGFFFKLLYNPICILER
jgi:hypothetical protein